MVEKTYELDGFRFESVPENIGTKKAYRNYFVSNAQENRKEFWGIVYILDEISEEEIGKFLLHFQVMKEIRDKIKSENSKIPEIFLLPHIHGCGEIVVSETDKQNIVYALSKKANKSNLVNYGIDKITREIKIEFLKKALKGLRILSELKLCYQNFTLENVLIHEDEKGLNMYLAGFDKIVKNENESELINIQTFMKLFLQVILNIRFEAEKYPIEYYIKKCGDNNDLKKFMSFCLEENQKLEKIEEHKLLNPKSTIISEEEKDPLKHYLTQINTPKNNSIELKNNSYKPLGFNDYLLKIENLKDFDIENNELMKIKYMPFIKFPAEIVTKSIEERIFYYKKFADVKTALDVNSNISNKHIMLVLFILSMAIQGIHSRKLWSLNITSSHIRYEYLDKAHENLSVEFVGLGHYRSKIFEDQKHKDPYIFSDKNIKRSLFSSYDDKEIMKYQNDDCNAIRLMAMKFHDSKKSTSDYTNDKNNVQFLESLENFANDIEKDTEITIKKIINNKFFDELKFAKCLSKENFDIQLYAFQFVIDFNSGYAFGQCFDKDTGNLYAAYIIYNEMKDEKNLTNLNNQFLDDTKQLSDASLPYINQYSSDPQHVYLFGPAHCTLKYYLESMAYTIESKVILKKLAKAINKLHLEKKPHLSLIMENIYLRFNEKGNDIDVLLGPRGNVDFCSSIMDKGGYEHLRPSFLEDDDEREEFKSQFIDNEQKIDIYFFGIIFCALTRIEKVFWLSTIVRAKWEYAIKKGIKDPDEQEVILECLCHQGNSNAKSMSEIIKMNYFTK